MRSYAKATTLARRPRNAERAADKVKSLREQLTDCLIAEDLEEAVNVLRGTLKATKHQPMGKFSSIEVPDHSARVSAAKLILEYAVGKPATSTELTISPNAGQLKDTEPSEVVARLKNSGLNLVDIFEAYTEEAEPEEPDEQAEEDSRAQQAFLDG